MTQDSSSFNFVHCDVFAARAYSGNSLAVITDSNELNTAQMLSITQELRHFESIFLSETDGKISARVFDLLEELPFAGHPVIGAACVLHKRDGGNGERTWQIGLQGDRIVTVTTTYDNGRYVGNLNQGQPHMIAEIPEVEKPAIAEAFNLNATDISSLPLEVISTGLKYLIVPVSGGLANARITIPDLEEKLEDFGAEYAYLFDINAFQGRHWNNDGIMEDVATGSAAGAIGAYALKHDLVQSDQRFVLKQGHFMGRPSEILVTAFGTRNDITQVIVAGEVSFVGSGELVAP